MELPVNMNVDLQEVQKFSDFAKTWWNPEGPYQSLHDINPLRVKFIQDCIDLKGKTVLDVGCGGGLLTESFAGLGAKVMGIDQSAELIDVAKAHSNGTFNIDYQVMSAEALAENFSHPFDVLTCLEVLEHVPDPALLVGACAALVKPGGHIFFSTINRNLKSYLFAIVAGEYLLRLLPKGTHEYEKFIRPSELVSWARTADLGIIKFAGMGYQPLLKHYFLTENIDVNYLAYFRAHPRQLS